MFGYVQPYKPLLLVKDYEYYRGVYCSLCKQLGKNYGVFARMTLSYDCTFYAIMAMSISGVCPKFKNGRCAFNPLKKCNYCTQGQTELSLAAAVTVASVYYKLEDDIHDDNVFKQLISRIIKIPAKRWKNKAEKTYPKVVSIVKKMSEAQLKAEEDELASVDKLSEPTAIMLQELMQILVVDSTQEQICREFGYFLGKWIYLMDAADDYEDDKKKNNTNPFVYYFKDKDVSEKERKEYINNILNDTVSRIIPAYNLIEFKKENSVLENMANHGFGQMQKKIIFENSKAKVKKKEGVKV